MSLAHDLHRAHKDRLARIDAAARRARAEAALRAPVPAPLPKRRVTLPPGLVRLLTAPEVERMPKTTESVRAIVETLASMFGVKAVEIPGKSQKKPLIIPRQIAIWAATKAISDVSLAWLTGIFQKHHTTLIYAYQKIEAEKSVHQKAIKDLSIAIGLPLADMPNPTLLEFKALSKLKAGGIDARKNQPCQSGGGAKPLGVEGGAEGKCAGYGKRKPRRRPRSPVTVAAPPKAGGTGGGEAAQGEGSAHQG